MERNLRNDLQEIFTKNLRVSEIHVVYPINLFILIIIYSNNLLVIEKIP